jgi:hypothetical protein
MLQIVGIPAGFIARLSRYLDALLLQEGCHGIKIFFGGTHSFERLGVLAHGWVFGSFQCSGRWRTVARQSMHPYTLAVIQHPMLLIFAAAHSGLRHYL